MNITFTNAELSSFATSLQAWHQQKTLFMCENFFRQDGFRFSANPEREFQRISDEFEKSNPKPDWRNLL